MYVDFEVILELIQGPSQDPKKSYTKKVNQHIPSGYCVYRKFAYGKVENPLKLYKGKNCIEMFLDYIKEEAHRLYHMFPEKPMDPLTKSNGNDMRKQVGAIFVLNLLTPKTLK